MSKSLLPPERLEQRILLKYPRLIEHVEHMLGMKDELHWPDWCYLPMSASHAITTMGAERDFAYRILAANGLQDMQAMSAIIPWRLHKAIFRFDPDLQSELIEQTTLPEDIPAVLLEHMPYPCVYIANPPGVKECDGLFVFLEWDERYPDAMELRMHYLFNDDMIIPLYYQFTDDRQSLAARMAENNAEIYRKVAGEVEAGIPHALSRYSDCIASMPNHLSMLVYLCSEEPDFVRTADVPRPRGRGRYRSPNWSDQVQVGSYIGSVIRMGRTQRQAQSDGEPGTGSAKRPHMRRAHWHLYWTGEGRAVPKVKWVMPIFVHGEGAEVPTVQHTVKGPQEDKQ